MKKLPLNELKVENIEGAWGISSIEVAKMLEKQHKDLLESIRGYIKHLTSGKFRSSEFFIPNTYLDRKREQRPCYYITRKGCDMIAHKMTGKKGILFTAAYVNKFYEIEQSINLPRTYKEALQALLIVEEEKEGLQLENQSLKPKGEYFDALVERNLLTNFRDTAKELKMQQNEFISSLLEQGYVYRDVKGTLKPYARYVPELFEIKEGKRGNWFGTQTLITPKGRETFRLLLKQRKAV